MNKKALIESLKEISRWVVCIIVSFFITETLKQLQLVPEFVTLKVWVFTYLLPLRTTMELILTLIGRGVDKYIFEKSKLNKKVETKGIIPF